VATLNLKLRYFDCCATVKIKVIKFLYNKYSMLRRTETACCREKLKKLLFGSLSTWPRAIFLKWNWASAVGAGDAAASLSKIFWGKIG